MKLLKVIFRCGASLYVTLSVQFVSVICKLKIFILSIISCGTAALYVQILYQLPKSYPTATKQLPNSYVNRPKQS